MMKSSKPVMCCVAHASLASSSDTVSRSVMISRAIFSCAACVAGEAKWSPGLDGRGMSTSAGRSGVLERGPGSRCGLCMARKVVPSMLV